MKKSIVLFLTVVTLGFVSCGTDDDVIIIEQEETITNEFVVDETSYALDNAKLFTDSGTSFKIWLFSSTVQVNDAYDIGGMGDAVQITLRNEQETIEGEYIIDFDPTSVDLDFVPISDFVDVNFDGPGLDSFPPSSKGTILITKKEEEYIIKADITYTFFNDSTSDLKVTYKGLLPVQALD